MNKILNNILGQKKTNINKMQLGSLKVNSWNMFANTKSLRKPITLKPNMLKLNKTNKLKRRSSISYLKSNMDLQPGDFGDWKKFVQFLIGKFSGLNKGKNGYALKLVTIKSVYNDTQHNMYHISLAFRKKEIIDLPVDMYYSIGENSPIGRGLIEQGLNPKNWWLRLDINYDEVMCEVLEYNALSYQDSNYEGFRFGDTEFNINEIVPFLNSKEAEDFMSYEEI